MAKKRLDLTFPPRQSLKPIVYHLVKDFDVVPNILRAEILPGQQGRMLVELTGKAADLVGGMEYLANQGLKVREAASDIYLDDVRCVTCGLCTSVCRTGALTLSGDELVLDRDKCVLCEACVSACPRRAVTLQF